MVVRGIAVLIAFPVVALFGGVEPQAVHIKVQSSQKHISESSSTESSGESFPVEKGAPVNSGESLSVEEDAPVNSDKGEMVEPTEDGSYEIKNQIFEAQSPTGPGSIEKLTLPVVTLLVAAVLFVVTKLNPGKKTS